VPGPRLDEPLEISIVPPGDEARALAPLPVTLLALSPEVAAALERWGIGTLGELAALPVPALLRRLGAGGARLLAEARGEDDHPFVTAAPSESWIEALGLDWEVTTVEALAFVLHRQAARLAARLAVRDRGAIALTLTLRLAGGGTHVHRLGGLAPAREPRTLVRLALAAPVVGLTLEAETVPLDPLQADLFAPPRPSPRELGEILGRLAALVGPDRVGAPALADTHRPDAVRAVPFGSGDSPGSAGGLPTLAAPARPATAPPLAAGRSAVPGTAFVRRRLVPPLAATVAMRAGRPVAVAATGIRGSILAAAGPWRTTGEWWTDTAWAREEWDVALPDGAVYRLARDLAAGTWTLDMVYD
jgi:protein ImuB